MQELEIALTFLQDEQFIKFQPEDQTFVYTPLGEATFKSSFSPEEALTVAKELQQDTITLNDELHLCYFITPIHNLPRVDWNCYYQLFGRLDEKKRQIAQLCMVSEEFLSRQATNPNSLNESSTSSHQLMRSTRFFYAMVLNDVSRATYLPNFMQLLNEMPLHLASAKYKMTRGDLQQLLTSAQTFAIMTCNLCKTLNYWALGVLLSAFCKRLDFGCREEIIPLTEIKGVKKAR